MPWFFAIAKKPKQVKGESLKRTNLSVFCFYLSPFKPAKKLYSREVTMKLITRDTDYAIRALSCMAGSEKEEFSTKELNDLLNIPRPFLRKLLQMLNKAGILKSTKGKGGGFKMIRHPDKITVFSLIEIFQGPFEISEHVFRGGACPYLRSCSFRKKLNVMEKHIIKEMKSISIASLVKSSAKSWLKKPE